MDSKSQTQDLKRDLIFEKREKRITFEGEGERRKIEKGGKTWIDKLLNEKEKRKEKMRKYLKG